MTFLVPALLRMALDGRGRHAGGVIRPRLLVMAPTRELAMQSHNVVIEIGGECVSGGVSDWWCDVMR
jgi:superfamily II DNA/RNA helicase